MKRVALWLFLKAFGVSGAINDLIGGKVTGTINIVLQILAILVQMGTVFSGMVPDEWRPIVVAVVAVIQAVLGKMGISRNPDGKPVTLAYNATTGKSFA